MSEEAHRAFARWNQAEAAKLFKVHLQSQPDDIDSRLWKSECHIILNQRSQIAAEFSQIMQFADFESPEYQLAMAWLSSVGNGGKLDEQALAERLRQLTTSECKSAWLFYKLGQVEQDPNNKISALKKCVELDRSNHWFHVTLALALENTGRFYEAFNHFATAVAICDDSVIGHIGTARKILVQNAGQFTDAAYQHFSKANTLNSSIAAYFILNDILDAGTGGGFLAAFSTDMIILTSIIFNDSWSTRRKFSNSKIFETSTNFENALQILQTVPKNKISSRIAPDGQTIAYVQGSVGEYLFKLSQTTGSKPTLQISRLDGRNILNDDLKKIVFILGCSRKMTSQQDVENCLVM